jgi:hypothetical protein
VKLGRQELLKSSKFSQTRVGRGFRKDGAEEIRTLEQAAISKRFLDSIVLLRSTLSSSLNHVVQTRIGGDDVNAPVR